MISAIVNGAATMGNALPGMTLVRRPGQEQKKGVTAHEDDEL